MRLANTFRMFRKRETDQGIMQHILGTLHAARLLENCRKQVCVCPAQVEAMPEHPDPLYGL
jgi:hypothetical protein